MAGEVWIGEAGYGMDRYVKVRYGMAGTVWQGLVRWCQVWHREVRYGKALQATSKEGNNGLLMEKL